MTMFATRPALAGVAGLALIAAIAAPATGYAQSKPSEIRQREQILKDGIEAQEERDQQARDASNSQQQRLQYQVRRAQRMNRQMQCRANGLPKDC